MPKRRSSAPCRKWLTITKAAQSRELTAAFEKHEGETEEHVSRLEKAFEALGQTPKGKTCDAILGDHRGGKEVMKEFTDTPALDAGLLAAAQAVEHYQISRYGTVRTWAAKLGHNDIVNLLEPTLAEEKKTNDTLPIWPRARSISTRRPPESLRFKPARGAWIHPRVSEFPGTRVCPAFWFQKPYPPGHLAACASWLLVRVSSLAAGERMTDLFEIASEDL